MKIAYPFTASLLAAIASAGPVRAQLTKDQTVLQALQNERDEGFNTHLASPGGLYINWVYASNPPPTLVNVQSNGTPDANPASRHDRLTDLEFMADLCLYKQANPTDTQFDATISAYTSILQSSSDDKFLSSPDRRGWTYWAMLDIIPTVPSFDGAQNTQADTYYNQYTANLSKYGNQVTPIYISTSLDATGTYRVDWLVEEAEVLIENGRSRGLSNYISAGEQLLSFAQSHAYSPTLNLWAHQMGHLFSDSTLTTVAAASAEYIVDSSVDMGEVSELCEAFARAEYFDPGKGYGSAAKATLDKLYPTNNSYGIWDAANTGYYAAFLWSEYGSGNPGAILASGLAVSPNTAYKEVGRATSAELAYYAANKYAGYAYDLTPITDTDLKSYYAAGHGWLYQMNDNFTLYTHDDPSGQNWVTSEAIGHACRALLTSDLVQPPPPPTNLSATAGDKQVALSWTASPRASSYNVKRSATSGGPYSTVANVTTTSYTNTGLTDGTTYYFVVSAVNSSGEGGNSSQVSATPQASGGGLTDADIGSPGLAGSASSSGGTWTVEGSGGDTLGSGGTTDNCNFAYEALSGDTTVVAHVAGEQNTNAWAKAGVMIRQSTSANAAAVAVFCTPTTTKGIDMAYRTSSGSGAANTQKTGVSAPYWVKLVRSGSTFTGYLSPDGSAWTKLASVTVTMADPVLVGIFVCSHDNTQLNTSTFDNVSL